MHIHFNCIGRVLSSSGEPCKGVVGRQLKADGAGVVNRFDHREIVTSVESLRSGIIGRPQVVIRVTRRVTIVLRIPMHTTSQTVETTRILNGIRNRDILARVLIEQMTGGIKCWFCVSYQCAREGIFTTPLVERVITLFCAVGVLRDKNVTRLDRKSVV